MNPSAPDANRLLKAFAAFLLQDHHLQALSAENLRLLRQLNVPLLRFFSHLSDAELLKQGEEGMRQFLTDFLEDRALDRAAESLEAWKEDRLPGIPKESIEPSDLVLVYAAQKQTLLHFLPEFTTDAATAMAIIQALENYYTRVQEDAFQFFARMRRESESQLAESRRMLQEAESIAHVGSWELDLASGQVRWSNELYRILGYAPGAIAPSTELFFQAVHAEDQDRVAQHWKDRIAAGLPVMVDYRVLRPDGTVRWVHGRGDVLREDGHEPFKALGVVQDITERYEAEQEIRQRTRELEEANAQLQTADRYKDEFLSVISHELRTPLNFIVGFASILEDELHGPLAPEQHHDLQRIMEGADRMLGLVNDILDVAKIQAGKLSIEREPTAVAPLVEATAANLKPLADRKGVQLKVEAQSPGVYELDGGRIGQVLTNLINNAIKFTPKGGQVSVRSCEEGERLRIEISDTGPGIAEADVSSLFKRFQQLNMSATREAGGTGLGLAISRGIVEAHGGTIGVDSRLGRGATFWFTLPFHSML